MRDSPGTITTYTTTTRRRVNNGVFGHITFHGVGVTKGGRANTISFVSSNGVVSGVEDCGLKASICFASHLPSLPFVIIIASALCFTHIFHERILASFWRYCGLGLDRRLGRCTVMRRVASVLLFIATNVTTTILHYMHLWMAWCG